MERTNTSLSSGAKAERQDASLNFSRVLGIVERKAKVVRHGILLSTVEEKAPFVHFLLLDLV